MGYGDYIFWTAFIRELYNYIYITEKNEEIVNRINLLINKNNEFGITHYIKKNNNKFKFYLTLDSKRKKRKRKKKLKENIQANEIFTNNDFITTDENYSNIIYLTIMSDAYWYKVKESENKIPILYKSHDKTHVVKYFLSRINLPIEYVNNAKTHGYIKFTDEEIKKVQKYLPKEEFIVVNYQSKTESKSYNKKKMQNIVDYLKNKIKIVQIIPKKFQNVKFDGLNNVILIKNKFTFRETICFLKNAKYTILVHGGLSNGIACFNIPTICLYSNICNPIMTKCDNEIPYIFCKHGNFCYNLNNCNECLKFGEKSDEKELLQLIKKNFNL